MSVYRLPRNRKNDYRTPSYRFTVTSKDDSSLVALKEGIARKNASVRKWCRANNAVGQYDKLHTVRLMARGPRRWHTKFGDMARYHKAQRGIPDRQQLLHGNADSNLNHRFAEEFDVYVHRSNEMEDSLRTEIDTGQSPGVQRKIEKLKHKIWDLEQEARREMLGYSNKASI
tara:strand:- start:1306 stop:1821 length:516 start_codon:yes stop_codon:yes gene_type:complete